MNFDLSAEQRMLRESAAGTLSRHASVAAARDALDGAGLPDLWPRAIDAGWPGLLISEERGGAGLGPFEAMLIAEEVGRAMAPVPLLGHLVATMLVASAASTVGAQLHSLAAGDLRAACALAMPPTEIEPRWTVDAVHGSARVDAPRIARDGSVTGSAAWVTDAPGADILVVVGLGDVGVQAVLVDAAAAGVSVVEASSYDPTRALGHISLESAPGIVLVGADCEAAWDLAQALLAAEAVGTGERALAVAVDYAKDRKTFGRAIGSYQAIKHGLVEALRQLDNARSLLLYTGWAFEHAPEERAVASAAARGVADRALSEAIERLMSVHGGVGVTWEHDAPYFYRRGEVARRLVGGTSRADERLADRLLAAT